MAGWSKMAKSDLSYREAQVVDLLCIGCNGKEISSELGISLHTVRTHVRNIYAKLGVSNRLELASWHRGEFLSDGEILEATSSTRRMCRTARLRI